MADTTGYEYSEVSPGVSYPVKRRMKIAGGPSGMSAMEETVEGVVVNGPVDRSTALQFLHR
jgi:hypothetical protein